MQFIKQSVIHSTSERVFAFHELPDALERLMPPWETAKVIQRADISVVGSRAIIETQVVGPIKVRWVASTRVMNRRICLKIFRSKDRSAVGVIGM